MDLTKEKQNENFTELNREQPSLQFQYKARALAENRLTSDTRESFSNRLVRASAALGVWIFSVAVLGVLGVLAVLAYAGLKNVPLSEVKNLAADPGAIVASLSATFPAHILTLVVAWAFVTRGAAQPFFKSLGWTWSRNFGFWSCVFATVLLYAAALGIITLFGEQENELIKILQSSRTAVYLTAIMATFTAPLAEEVVYRGVMYPAFKDVLGTNGAVALVTFFFAIVHVPQYYPSYGAILVILLLSLVLTLIRAWTDSLLPCFVIHTLFNGVQALLLVFEPLLPKGNAPADAPTPSLFFWENLF